MTGQGEPLSSSSSLSSDLPIKELKRGQKRKYGYKGEMVDPEQFREASDTIVIIEQSEDDESSNSLNSTREIDSVPPKRRRGRPPKMRLQTLPKSSDVEDEIDSSRSIKWTTKSRQYPMAEAFQFPSIVLRKPIAKVKGTSPVKEESVTTFASSQNSDQEMKQDSTSLQPDESIDQDADAPELSDSHANSKEVATESEKIDTHPTKVARKDTPEMNFPSSADLADHHIPRGGVQEEDTNSEKRLKLEQPQDSTFQVTYPIEAREDGNASDHSIDKREKPVESGQMPAELVPPKHLNFDNHSMPSPSGMVMVADDDSPPSSSKTSHIQTKCTPRLADGVSRPSSLPPQNVNHHANHSHIAVISRSHDSPHALNRINDQNDPAPLHQDSSNSSNAPYSSQKMTEISNPSHLKATSRKARRSSATQTDITHANVPHSSTSASRQSDAHMQSLARQHMLEELKEAEKAALIRRVEKVVEEIRLLRQSHELRERERERERQRESQRERERERERERQQQLERNETKPCPNCGNQRPTKYSDRTEAMPPPHAYPVIPQYPPFAKPVQSEHLIPIEHQAGVQHFLHDLQLAFNQWRLTPHEPAFRGMMDVLHRYYPP